MNLSDRIIKAAEELGPQKDKLEKLEKKLTDLTDNYDPSDDEATLEQIEALTDELNELRPAVEKAQRTLDTLRKAEKDLADRARPADNPNGAPGFMHFSAKKDPKKPGDVMFKHAVVKFLSFVEKKDPQQIIQERYADTPYVKATFDFVTKSAVAPAMTDVAGWAEELTREDTRGFIDTLKDVSVAAALAGRATSLDFGGANSIKIPRRNPLAAAITEPAWVAEGRPIPLTKFSFGSTTLNRYKLAAITTFTREIAERSTPAIEGLLRDALREAYAEVLDGALLNNAAKVDGVRPSGLLYDDFGAAAIASLAPTGGGGEDAVRGDIMNLVAALTGARLGSRPVLLVNNLDRLAASMMTSALSEYLFRDELASGNLMGIPVIASGNVPQHHLVIVDAAYLATAFDAPMFDVSDVATVVEASADTTPPTTVSDQSGAAGAAAGQVGKDEGIMVAGSGGGAANTGYTARSLWQTYSVGIRMIAPTAWGVMQPGAVAHITPTTWTP